MLSYTHLCMLHMLWFNWIKYVMSSFQSYLTIIKYIFLICARLFPSLLTPSFLSFTTSYLFLFNLQLFAVYIISAFHVEKEREKKKKKYAIDIFPLRETGKRLSTNKNWFFWSSFLSLLLCQSKRDNEVGWFFIGAFWVDNISQHTKCINKNG